MPQQQFLPFAFICRKVVEMGRYPHGSQSEDQFANEIVDEALTLTFSAHLQNKIYPELSGGEAQRIQLARALAQIIEASGDAKLLLLDEPTSNLDPRHQNLVLSLLRKLTLIGISSVCVLHDLNLAASYCDRVAVLKNGQTQDVGSVDKVLRSDLIKSVFDIDVEIFVHPQRRGPVIITLNQ